MARPFKILVEQDVLDDLHRRLDLYRAPFATEDRGWEDGINLRYLGELVAYWRERFDWLTQEATLNQLHHYMADIRGTALHFVHERGRGPAPLPLLLVHGWPDGFQRFARLIPLLTDPAAHGGAAADAFDVVVPSLPGFGFSARGADGPSLDSFGDLLHDLMTKILGYRRYGAHGGDVGAMVCDQLYRRPGDALAGIHLTNVSVTASTDDTDGLTDAERDFLTRREDFQKHGGGYAHIQGTKPCTLAVGLNDSPAGLAAWIVEKMRAWSDCGGDVERRFGKDDLLTNVMLYWVTGSIGTSFLGYRDMMKPVSPLTAATHDRGARSTAAGFAIFPKDIANAPREWAGRFYNVRHWSEMPAGGHFAAWEEPELLAEDIRAFFRPLR